MMAAYWVGSAAGWAALTAVYAWLWRRERASAWWAGGVVMGVALLLRAPWVWWSEPYLSTDLWRYLFDGANVAAGANPYAVTPSEYIAAHGDPGWMYRMNNHHLATIYQPVSQAVFGLFSVAGVDFRAGFVAIDLGVVAAILWGLARAGRSAWWATLYAWHPLSVTEVAWSGHQDVVGLLPLVLAVVAARSVSERGDGRGLPWAGATGALWALVVAVKPVAGPAALAVAAGWGRRRVGATVAACVAGAAVLAAAYLPFAAMEGGLDGMLRTGKAFTRLWEWNASVHGVVRWVAGSKTAADAACGVALLGVLAGLAWRVRDAAEAAMVFLFAGLLLSSTAHPWYLLWSLALLPLCPRGWASPAVWVLSLTIGWSYTAVFTADFKPYGWARWAEYVPVFVALGWGAWVATGGRGRRSWGFRRGPACR